MKNQAQQKKKAGNVISCRKQFAVLDAYPEWFQFISVIRNFTLVNIMAFIISRFNYFLLKHLPPFREGPLHEN